MNTLEMAFPEDWPVILHKFASALDEQVRTWLAETQFTLLDVTEGDEYRHYLTKKE